MYCPVYFSSDLCEDHHCVGSGIKFCLLWVFSSADYVDYRLLNDLVLWEPMAPRPIDTQETNSFMPGSAWSPHLVAQLMNQGPVSENFAACKSGVQYGMCLCF